MGSKKCIWNWKETWTKTPWRSRSTILWQWSWMERWVQHTIIFGEGKDFFICVWKGLITPFTHSLGSSWWALCSCCISCLLACPTAPCGALCNARGWCQHEPYCFGFLQPRAHPAACTPSQAQEVIPGGDCDHSLEKPAQEKRREALSMQTK